MNYMLIGLLIACIVVLNHNHNEYSRDRRLLISNQILHSKFDMIHHLIQMPPFDDVSMYHNVELYFTISKPHTISAQGKSSFLPFHHQVDINLQLTHVKLVLGIESSLPFYYLRIFWSRYHWWLLVNTLYLRSDLIFSSTNTKPLANGHVNKLYD